MYLAGSCVALRLEVDLSQYMHSRRNLHTNHKFELTPSPERGLCDRSFRLPVELRLRVEPPAWSDSPATQTDPACSHRPESSVSARGAEHLDRAAVSSQPLRPCPTETGASGPSKAKGGGKGSSQDGDGFGPDGPVQGAGPPRCNLQRKSGGEAVGHLPTPGSGGCCCVFFTDSTGSGLNGNGNGPMSSANREDGVWWSVAQRGRTETNVESAGGADGRGRDGKTSRNGEREREREGGRAGGSRLDREDAWGERDQPGRTPVGQERQPVTFSALHGLIG
ncbi:hypothetical protein VTK73DRAFT_10170 [Phialemonium thermophilum]|uniref:Uncharacterized protein n=1 Tax=Phialemonium thermophilum TaxID=223376 RepID=A0ABR3VY49_9PEZI